MHKSILILSLILTALIAKGQDTIYTKSGQILLVEIIDQDSTQVNFELEKNDRTIQTYILKSDLLRIGYTRTE